MGTQPPPRIPRWEEREGHAAWMRRAPPDWPPPQRERQSSSGKRRAAALAWGFSLHFDLSPWGRLGANAELNRDLFRSGSVLRHRRKIPARPDGLHNAGSVNVKLVVLGAHIPQV